MPKATQKSSTKTKKTPRRSLPAILDEQNEEPHNTSTHNTRGSRKRSLPNDLDDVTDVAVGDQNQESSDDEEVNLNPPQQKMVQKSYVTMEMFEQLMKQQREQHDRLVNTLLQTKIKELESTQNQDNTQNQSPRQPALFDPEQVREHEQSSGRSHTVVLGSSASQHTARASTGALCGSSLPTKVKNLIQKGEFVEFSTFDNSDSNETNSIQLDFEGANQGKFITK